VTGLTASVCRVLSPLKRPVLCALLSAVRSMPLSVAGGACQGALRAMCCHEPEAHSLVIDIVDWERTPCGRTQTEVGVALKSSHTFSRRPWSTLGATTHALAEPSIVIREIRPHSATDHTGGLVWSGHGHVSNRTVKRSPLARHGRHDRHDSHDID
jgi:hypothetical protein